MTVQGSQGFGYKAGSVGLTLNAAFGYCVLFSSFATDIADITDENGFLLFAIINYPLSIKKTP